jgi:uncharacterized protein (DUF1778 family)
MPATARSSRRASHRIAIVCSSRYYRWLSTAAATAEEDLSDFIARAVRSRAQTTGLDLPPPRLERKRFGQPKTRA